MTSLVTAFATRSSGLRADAKKQPKAARAGGAVNMTTMPTRRELALPILRAIHQLGGSASRHQIIAHVIEAVDPSGVLRVEKTPKAGVPSLEKEIGWGIAYGKGDFLPKLLEHPSRGIYALTAEGTRVSALPDAQANDELDKMRAAGRAAREREQAAQKAASAANNGGSRRPSRDRHRTTPSVAADFSGEFSVLLSPSGRDAEQALKLTIFSPAALKVAVVDRSQLAVLDPDWSSSGVYVLLERPDSDGCWVGYVGKSAAVKGRLGGHLHKKPGWYKAVAVCPEGTGWDEAEVSWLEARLHRLLLDASNVAVSNNQEPNDGRLSEVRQMRVNKVTHAVASVLALIGHPINSGRSMDDTTERTDDGRTHTASQRRGVKVKTLLDAGLLAAGETLTLRKPVKGTWQQHSVTVDSDGCLLTSNGERYNSPSAASMALSQDQVTGGWWGWQRADGQTLSDLREDYLRSKRDVADEPKPAPTATKSTMGRPPRRFNAVKLSDLLDAGYLKPGTPIVSRHKRSKSRHFAGDGRAEIEADGTITVPGVGEGYGLSAAQYASLQPSEDEPSVSGGWYYWEIAGTDEGLGDVRFRYLVDLWTGKNQERLDHLRAWLEYVEQNERTVASWSPPPSEWSAAHPTEAQTVQEWRKWLSSS